MSSSATDKYAAQRLSEKGEALDWTTLAAAVAALRQNGMLNFLPGNPSCSTTAFLWLDSLREVSVELLATVFTIIEAQLTDCLSLGKSLLKPCIEPDEQVRSQTSLIMPCFLMYVFHHFKGYLASSKIACLLLAEYGHHDNSKHSPAAYSGKYF